MLVQRMLCLTLLVTLPLGPGGAALAEGLEKTFGPSRFFDPAAGGSLCYRRSYSADHLAGHPDQQVTAIALAQMPEARDQTTLILYVRTRSSVETYVGSAYCQAGGTGLDCLMEGDAGQFSLEAASKGALRLTVAARGISFEGSRDFVTLVGTSGDDRVFLVPPLAADRCDRLVASGELN